ncbi:MAG: ABC transporter ATP-binding protein [Actinobacteria bacterium]|nr:ABC transporter ATP-binding protein [Actinomycetota bacterium]
MEIIVNNLLFEYDHNFMLDISNFTLRNGEVVSLMGPNGAGKTTFLLLLSLQIKPGAGEIFYDNKLPACSRDILSLRRRISAVLQKDYLFNDTVFDNVAYPLKIRRFGSSEIERKVRSYLELFGVGHLANKRVKELSSGQSKRVCLARSVVYSPEVIFFDEPTSLIDFGTKEEILSDLKKAIRHLKASAVFVTQDKTEAFLMSDRLVFMNGGRVLEDGTPEDISFRPTSVEAATFFGKDNLLNGMVAEKEKDLIKIRVKNHTILGVGDADPGDEVLFMLSPEGIVLSKSIDENLQSARNVIYCDVLDVNDVGSVVQVELFCGFRLRASITRISAEMLDLRAGSRIIASFKASAVHVIKRG